MGQIYICTDVIINPYQPELIRSFIMSYSFYFVDASPSPQQDSTITFLVLAVQDFSHVYQQQLNDYKLQTIERETTI